MEETNLTLVALCLNSEQMVWVEREGSFELFTYLQVCIVLFITYVGPHDFHDAEFTI